MSWFRRRAWHEHRQGALIGPWPVRCGSVGELDVESWFEAVDRRGGVLSGLLDCWAGLLLWTHPTRRAPMIIYTICLVVGLAFTLISAIAGHFFGGHDGDLGTGGHAEAGFDSSGLPGISFFSPTVLATFVTAFGALGLVFSQIEATKSVWASAPLSAVGGMTVAGVVFLLFNAMFKRTQSSSESRVGSLQGHEATIITPIPAGGVGEIAYVQSGSRYTAPARSLSNEAIGNGRAVRIAKIVGTQFYVEPL